MSDRIIINPDICNGKPTVRGTRITVQTILEFVASGDFVEALLEQFPTLSREDVQASLEFASQA